MTNDMINMFENNKVIIAPELNIKDLMFKGMDLDEIIDFICKKGYSIDDFLYKADDFEPCFKIMLENDKRVIEGLCNIWNSIDEDPKLDKFSENLDHFISSNINPENKLVIFSESVDTVNYLYKFLTEQQHRTDVLCVAASNRGTLFDTIKANFDANVPEGEQKNDYSIIVTSDVLAEGVNLHRSNVIVNYDSPWNASRLMQRIGRVNRIGSVAENIHNFMFYPSPQGDAQIQLYKNALIKLQGFHSAYGEDAQIYSREEIVKEFQLFDSNVRDVVDKKIALLRELRNLYNSNREWYHKIKELPLKSRVIRGKAKYRGSSIVFVSTRVKTEFYFVKSSHNPVAIDFLSAIDYLKAKPEEMPLPLEKATEHFAHVNAAVSIFETDLQQQTDANSIRNVNLDKTAQTADAFLRKVEQICDDATLKSHCAILKNYIKQGTYAKLPKTLKAISSEYKNDRLKIKHDTYILQQRIGELVEEYHNNSNPEESAIGAPSIIISETFI